MSHAVVDLFTVSFWAVVAAAMLVLTPLTCADGRQGAFAAINIAFLWLLQPLLVPGAIGGVVVVYVLLRMATPGPRAQAVLWLLLSGALAIMVVHKLPQLSPPWEPFISVHPALAAIGFSYVFLRIVEVSRAVCGERHRAPGPLALFNYLMPFHMLAAGPIQSYDDFASQPAVPAPLSRAEALRGVERIAFGLFKKFVVAYTIERVFLTGFSTGGWYFLLEVHLYALWFYIDFSAYSDIAAGIGKLIGVRTPENFNQPYLARNMIDFWERWHITLGLWLRRNLFIPLQLGLSRHTQGRHGVMVATVSLGLAFCLCGLWHGATLPFFVWGAMHGVGIMVTNLYRTGLRRLLGKAGLGRYLSNPWIRAAATALTIEWVAASLVVVGWQWETSL